MAETRILLYDRIPSHLSIMYEQRICMYASKWLNYANKEHEETLWMNVYYNNIKWIILLKIIV